MRETGILMAVSSLPGPYGAGDLGPEAMHWIDLLAENGVTVWQLLPLGPTGYGNSPYQTYSSRAGDPLYLSLEGLYEAGLLPEKPAAFDLPAGRVDYEQVRRLREPWLRRAYGAFRPDGDYAAFAAQGWVRDYAVFAALKARHGMACWLDWPEPDRSWPQTRDPAATADLEAEIGYQIFLQYEFLRQWNRVRAHAHSRGVRLMGDVPFYVGVDSVEVWAGRENFLLDSDGRPSFIAGVPPDYFSATGQRWGNPIYDWDRLRADGYRFWVERIGYCQTLFDLIRIDHFRAFDTFWKIPATCPTAVEGAWIEAPGYEVLDTLYAKLPGLQLVAEDLGDLRPQVLTLRDHYRLPGMKVLEFTLQPVGRYVRDLGEDRPRQIVYTGTHDNDTVQAWYASLSASYRRKLRKYLKTQGLQSGTMARRLILLGLRSRAALFVAPLQDVLSLGAAGRMNLPGAVGSPNWEWRLDSWPETARQLKALRPAILARQNTES